MKRLAAAFESVGHPINDELRHALDMGAKGRKPKFPPMSKEQSVGIVRRLELAMLHGGGGDAPMGLNEWLKNGVPPEALFPRDK